MLPLVLLYVCVLFVLGLALGSFLNVVAWRTPQDISILRPPSSCPACGRAIAGRDNIPLLGYLLLHGKCRACGAKIAARYPLSELACGVLWAAVGARLAYLDQGAPSNIGIGLVWLFFVSTALVTVLTDLDFMIILDEVSLGGLLIALVASPLLPWLHHAADAADFERYHMVLAHFLAGSPAWLCALASSVLGAIVGVGFSGLIYHLGNAAFKKQIAAAREENPEINSALGLGDVKLMGFYGALFGWLGVFMIYLVGSVFGAVIGGAIKLAGGDAGGKTGIEGLRNRWNSSSSVIPFGPFLVFGALVWFFCGDRIFAALYM